MANSSLSEVMLRYMEPWRVYHNIDHPVNLLKVLRMLYRNDNLPKWVVDFAWYHDTVYVPGAKDNELRSAELFAVHVNAAIGEDAEPVFSYRSEEQTYRVILSTADHLGAPPNPSYDLCLDADLSILGASEEEYLEYCFGVESEAISYMSRVAPECQRKSTRESTQLYIAGRKAFVSKMLDYAESGNLLFRTKTAIDLWEDNARKNLYKEHNLLENRQKRTLR